MKITEEIKKELIKNGDGKYREFMSNLTPGITKESVIGIKTPELRSYAKELLKREDIDVFLNDLPHEFFEENQLHAFIISNMKDYEACMEKLNAFLPYVNNWATCDQMSPKIFKKHKKELLSEIKKWIASKETYKIRFGIKMLMEHFLDEDFEIKYPEQIIKIKSEEYYVKMMIAWYFATALAKQYDSVIPFIEEKRLETWTHNKTIQKAIESYRITDKQKAYLRTLKV
ncbi:MAG: DNA alkylation repair protein [Lachnospiraceae bacterium]|nr:DNA alkylation repair protein [Lachnospiraceae bacterium]